MSNKFFMLLLATTSFICVAHYENEKINLIADEVVLFKQQEQVYDYLEQLSSSAPLKYYNLLEAIFAEKEKKQPRLYIKVRSRVKLAMSKIRQKNKLKDISYPVFEKTVTTIVSKHGNNFTLTKPVTKS